MSRRDAGGGDDAREKVVEQTKLLDGSGVPKLLQLLGEEIFECVHNLQGDAKTRPQVHDCMNLKQLSWMLRGRKL